MKRAILLACFVVGCQPAESSSQATARRGAAATIDSARAEQMLAAADRGRISGDSTAKLWIIEFSDFQCPYCKMWHDSTYSAIRRDYVKTGQLRIAYLNFPLQQHT